MESKYSEDDRKITNRIRLYLQNIEDNNIKSMQMLNVINLMNYLSNNIDYIKKYPQFKKCVIYKCNILFEDNPKNVPPTLLENYKKSIINLKNLLI